MAHKAARHKDLAESGRLMGKAVQECTTYQTWADAGRMMVEGAAMEVEQTQAGATGAKALDRTSARASSTLIQASVSTAELQAALPIRPATRVVVPFLLHAPQARHLRVCGLSCLAAVSSFYMASTLLHQALA